MHPSPFQRAVAGGLAVLAAGGCVLVAALPEVAVSWCFWLALPLWAYARIQMDVDRASHWIGAAALTRAMLAISLVLAGGLMCHMLLNPLLFYLRAPDRLYPVLGLSGLLVGMVVAQWRSWPWFGLLFVARLKRAAEQSLWARLRERADELCAADDAFFADGLSIASASLVLLIAPVLLPLWPTTWSRYSLALLLTGLLLGLLEVILRRTDHARQRPSTPGPLPSFLAGTAVDEITDPDIAVVSVAAAGPNEDLLQAARRGDGEAVQRALALGADSNAVPSREAADQRTALIAAATAVDRSALRALIAAGAQVDRMSGGLTALLAATRDSYAGRVDAVMTLLSNGADPNLADESGNTPLHFAALTREASVAHCLLDAGARMDAINREYITPLALACEAGNWVVVEFLIKQGARADVADATPALLFAAAVDGDDPRGVKLLLKSRAKVNAAGPSGRTALMVAALADNAEIAEALLAAGADIETRDESGHSALLEAARAGANRVLRRLVPHRPDAQLTDIHGRNALHLAAQAHGADAETLSLLQALGCPPNALDQSGASAADLAAAAGRWPLVRVLNPEYVLPSTHVEEPEANDAQAPRIEPDPPGRLLVRAALQGRFPLYQELLQIPGISATELAEALQVALPHQDRRYIDALLDHGYDAFARPTPGPSLWERLCAARPLALYALEALLERLERNPNSAAVLLPGLCQVDASAAADDELQRLRARVFAIGGDLRAADHRGVPALHLAVGALPLHWIEQLVAAGVDANARDVHAQSALISLAWARRSDAWQVALLLIRAGSDPALPARDGSTPAAIARLTDQANLAELLDWPAGAHPGCPLDGNSIAAAGQRGDLATLDRLLSLGLDIDGCDAQGATALLHAAGTGQLELCKALLERGANPARRSAKGVTPLAAAILAGRNNIVEWLLARGVHRETVLLERMTALGLAAACLRLPLIESLLAAGADPEGRAAPDSPLQAALVQVKDTSRPVMAIEAVMTRLIEAGANPDQPDADGRAALHRLFGAGRTEPPMRDEARLQPLVLALLLGGANPNLPDKEGRTALHWACRHGLVQSGGTLLELGADPRVADHARQMPIDLLATRHRIHLGPALRQAAEAWNRQRGPHR